MTKGSVEEMERSISALAREFDLSLSTVSHHIKELRQAGLIRCAKRGQTVYCEADPAAVEAIGRFLSLKTGVDILVSLGAGYQVARRDEQLRLEAAGSERLATPTRRRSTHGYAEKQDPEQDTLRTWARDRVESRRRLRLRLAVFLLAMLVLTPVWAVSDYLSSGDWPQRLEPERQPG